MKNKFTELREKYPDFYYNHYNIKEDQTNIYLEYEFVIPNLRTFKPTIKILKKDFQWKDLSSIYVKNMVFNIGLVELISYWKCTCSPNVIIKCGTISEEQIGWWKKLYFNGLGELFYRNNIKTNRNDFMNISCDTIEPAFQYSELEDQSSGYIIPIGGGKDSIVTLETLKVNPNENYVLIMNPKPVTLNCAAIAGFSPDRIIEIYRTIDSNLLELNQEGFINGHTPFSSLLAFISYFIAYLLGKKYIALSNEASANESNIIGKEVNHQYSKSFEFECDFRDYAAKYLKAPVEYFSFLRPLNELQIAKIFSRQEKYHSIFKSCNVGSKEKNWIWCGNCAKCLFAYLILSPYLYKEKLVNIFKEDLLEKESLLDIFLELTGYKDTKPFDCVGTFAEVNFAIAKTIHNLLKQNTTLPYLLKYYYEHYPLVDTTHDITKEFNEENNLTEEQKELLRKEVFLND